MEREHVLGIVLLGSLAGCAAEAADASPRGDAAVTAMPTAGRGGRCTARGEGALPAQLSQLGCFEGDDPRWPSDETIAFAPNAPLFTDGAHKERFFALPAGSKIELDDRGDFVLPVGTVLVKTFSLAGARVETRVMMNDAVEGWHGASYRWNSQGDDAELVPAEGMKLDAAAGTDQTWTFPSRAQCGSCHGAETHVALGLEVAQLNGDFVDPHTGEGGNQLDRLIARGLLDGAHPTLADPVARPRLPPYQDAREPLEARARSYLHANCGSCHTDPVGYCTGDLRAATATPAIGMCDVEPKIPDVSFPDGTRLIAPGEPERSVIVHRMRAPGGSALAMPPVGRTVVDEEGVALITQWIAEMRACGQ